MRWRTWITMGSVFAVLVALASEVGADFDKRYTCYRTSGPIQVDGVLDESSWKTIYKAGPFRASVDIQCWLC